MHACFRSSCRLIGGRKLAHCRLFGLASFFVFVVLGIAAPQAKADFTMYVANGGDGTVSTITSTGVVSTFASGFDQPRGLAFDRNNNLYVTNYGNGTISKVTPAGVVSTFASGLNTPAALAFDGNDNLYVTDYIDDTVSMITPAGVVSLFASVGPPGGLAFDQNGNLYVTSIIGNTVYVIAPTGALNPFAGGFNNPTDIAFDGSGNLYVVNSGDYTVSAVTPAGVVSSFANGFKGPKGLVADGSCNLYLANAVNGTISEITPAGAVSTFASGLNGPTSLAMLSSPDIIQPNNQTVAASESATFSVSVISTPRANTFQWQRLPAGTSTWVNLTDVGGYSGSGTSTLTVSNATFAMSGDQFQCVATNVFGSNTSNPVALSVVAVAINSQPQNQIVTGNFSVGASGANLSYQWQVSTDGGGTWTAVINDATYDGATTATLSVRNMAPTMSGYEYECFITSSFGSATTNPATLTVMPFLMYLTVYSAGPQNLYSVSPTGTVSTFASGFDYPEGVVVDEKGILYVANYFGDSISKVSSTGIVSTFASGFDHPAGVAFDGGGNLYVANSGNNTVSVVAPSGVVSTFAGGFNSPAGLAFDASGNLYVANSGNNTVSVVTPSGAISTFASGFYNPQGLAFDGNGNLYVANCGNTELSEDIGINTVSVVSPDGVVRMFANGLTNPTGLAFDGKGNLYAGNSFGLSVITPDGVVSALSSIGGLYMAIVSTPAAPTITHQSSDQAVGASENAVFSFGISGAPGSNTFQWQRLPAGSPTWINLTDGGNYSGTASPILTVSNTTFAMSGDQFQCVATNAFGSSTTNVSTLSVFAVVIETQPQSQTVVGGNATFTVGASGANVNYKWQVSTDGGLTWTALTDDTNISGATTPALTVGALNASMSGYEYECVVTNSSGSATSSAAILTILPFLMYVTNQGDGTVSEITSAGVASTYASGFYNPQGLAFDPNGNLYVVNYTSGTVSVVTTAGAVSTYASGFNETYNGPVGLAIDANGNLYVTNFAFGLVFESIATSTGVLNSFAHGLNSPEGLAFDGNGNLYVANKENSAISRITTAGVVSTFASNLAGPFGLAFDGGGNLYVTNNNNGTVSVITPAGVVSTFAGGFSSPTGLAFDGSGNLYVVNNGNNTISMVTPAGVVSTFFTGLDTPLFIAITSTAAAPTVTRAPQNQTVAASVNSAAFSVDVSGAPGSNTFQWQRLPAGSSTWENLADGGFFTGSTTPTLTVTNSALAMSGDQFECVVTNTVGSTTSNPAILSVVPVIINTQPQNQIIVGSYAANFSVAASGANLGYQWQVSKDNGATWTTLADNSTLSGVTTSTLTASNTISAMSGYEYECVVTNLEGSATSSPGKLTILPFMMYVTNSNGTVSQVTPDGAVSTFAQGFLNPAGLAIDGNGKLYVANSNGTISQVTPAGVVSPFVSGLQGPKGLAFDGNENLYVANQNNGTISKVTPGKAVSTFASGFSGPQGLAFGNNGQFYVVNQFNGTVSAVTSAGTASTFASTFQQPDGLAIDGSRNLYVSNSQNGTISKVASSGVLSTFSNGTSNGFGNHPGGLAFDGSGNLYVAANGTIYKITAAGVSSQFATGLGNVPNAFIAIISATAIAVPTITSEPQSQPITAGLNATFSVGASGASGSNSFQWQRMPAGSSNWVTLSDNTFYSGSATAALTVLNTTASMTGDQYRCIAINSVGNTTSNSLSLTVNPPTSPPSSPASTFAAWQNLWFTPSQLNNSTFSSALASPTNDGVPNLVKYAFNLDPFNPPGLNGNPALPQPTVSNGKLTLTFNFGQSDLTYAVQVSNDLVDWTTEGINQQTNGSQITATYPVPATGSIFMRVVVTYQGP